MTRSRYLTLCLFALAMFGCRFSYAAEPFAYTLIGGSAKQNAYPAGVATWHNGSVAWAIEYGPKLQKQKLTRVLLHNPGGIFHKGWNPNPENVYDPEQMKRPQATGVDVREMWVDQWILAEESDCRHANREELRTCVGLLRYYGVTEVMFYVGGPMTLNDPLVDGQRVLEAFLDSGPPANVSFCFDATGDTRFSKWKPGDRQSQLFDWLRKRGHRVYVEARVWPDEPKLAKHIDGTVALADFDASPFWKPAFENAQKYGEVIRICDYTTDSTQGWPAHVTPAVRQWWTK